MEAGNSHTNVAFRPDTGRRGRTGSVEEQLYGTCFILPILPANMDLSLVLNTNTAAFIVLVLPKTRIYAPPLFLVVFYPN